MKRELKGTICGHLTEGIEHMVLFRSVGHQKAGREPRKVHLHGCGRTCLRLPDATQPDPAELNI